jgi:hypothetical protein
MRRDARRQREATRQEKAAALQRDKEEIFEVRPTGGCQSPQGTETGYAGMLRGGDLVSLPDKSCASTIGRRRGHVAGCPGGAHPGGQGLSAVRS